MSSLTEVPFGDIKPSQPDDGNLNISRDPITVKCLGPQQLEIKHGNHRYYYLKNWQHLSQTTPILVELIKNPDLYCKHCPAKSNCPY